MSKMMEVMKKNLVELVSVTVKINGVEKTFAKKDCYFYGWEFEVDCFSDSGVDLELTDGKKKYKLSIG
jgi:hypothetical protein